MGCYTIKVVFFPFYFIFFPLSLLLNFSLFLSKYSDEFSGHHEVFGAVAGHPGGGAPAPEFKEAF